MTFRIILISYFSKTIFMEVVDGRPHRGRRSFFSEEIRALMIKRNDWFIFSNFGLSSRTSFHLLELRFIYSSHFLYYIKHFIGRSSVNVKGKQLHDTLALKKIN